MAQFFTISLLYILGLTIKTHAPIHHTVQARSWPVFTCKPAGLSVTFFKFETAGLARRRREGERRRREFLEGPKDHFLRFLTGTWVTGKAFLGIKIRD